MMSADTPTAYRTLDQARAFLAMRAPKLFASAVITIAALIATQPARAQLCDSSFGGGGESIAAHITFATDGSALQDKMVVTPNTQLRLDAVATGEGSCDQWLEDWSGGTYHGCTIHNHYERTVNHIGVWADISTATFLNGSSGVGNVFGRNPDGTTAFLHVLNTQSADSTGPLYTWLPYPGTYQFHFQAYINPTPCDSQATIYTEVATITVYVRDPDDDRNNGPTSCNANVGQPVNVTNGNMYLQQTDYRLPGLGGGLQLTRTYNSQGQSKHVNLFGYGWASAYEESITSYGSDLVRLYLPDGEAVLLARNAQTGVFTAIEPASFRGQISRNADGSYTLTLKDGSVHQFNAAGKLVALIDRNNNQTSLTYDANGKLTTVTDPTGRTLQLAYDSGNGKVSAISDGQGTVATYTYSSFLAPWWEWADRLASVTYADGSKFTYDYDYPARLTAVRDALGNVVEAHTYDGQGRALTSERQDGVERVTLNYLSNIETDVTDALGHVTKYFFDKSKGATW